MKHFWMAVLILGAIVLSPGAYAASEGKGENKAEGIIKIDKSKTALVVIDLQKGAIARECRHLPYDGKTVVIPFASKLADALGKTICRCFLCTWPFRLTGKGRLVPLTDAGVPRNFPQICPRWGLEQISCLNWGQSLPIL